MPDLPSHAPAIRTAAVRISSAASRLADLLLAPEPYDHDAFMASVDVLYDHLRHLHSIDDARCARKDR